MTIYLDESGGQVIWTSRADVKSGHVKRTSNMDECGGQVRWMTLVDELGLRPEILSTAQRDICSFRDESGGQVIWIN